MEKRLIVPLVDYSAILKEFKISCLELPLFLQSGKPRQTQGWILHISVLPWQVIGMLKKVLPELKSGKYSFKVVKSKLIHLDINNGFYGNEKIGKALTIYLDEEEKGLALVPVLIQLISTFEGPSVLTDFQLDRNLFLRYGAFVDNPHTDDFGRSVNIIHDGFGKQYPDEYTVPPKLPPGIVNPFARWIKTPPRSEKPTSLGGRFFPWTILQSHIRGNVYKGVYFNKFFLPNWCVVKEGLIGMLADDKGRDVRDRLKWQCQMIKRLGNLVRVPALLEEFSEEDREYMAIEYIKSRSLAETCFTHLDRQPWWALDGKGRERLIGLVSQVVGMIDTLHRNGYLHRDINGNNFLVDGKERLHLIDLELVYEIRDDLPRPPFGKGTRGFISPAQAEDAHPVPEDDIYSIGATTGCLLSGLEPLLLIDEDMPAVQRRLELLLGESTVVDLVTDATDPLPGKRPSLETIKNTLHLVHEKVGNKPSGRADSAPPATGKVVEVIGRVMKTLGGSRLVENRYWYSLLDTGDTGTKNSYGNMVLQPGLYRGLAGAVYVCARAHRLGLTDRRLQDRVNSALHYLRDLTQPGKGLPSGLHSGTSGLALAFAEATHAGLLSAGAHNETAITGSRFRPNNLSDVLNGTAGDGLAILSTLDWGARERAYKRLDEIASNLVASQARDGSWPTIANAKGRLESIRGFGNGTAGIVYFLLEHGTRCNGAASLEAARKGLSWLAGKKVRDHGGIAWTVSDKNHERELGWQAGTAGIALTFWRAFEITGEGRWRDVGTMALRGLPRWLIMGDYGQANGLSGIGEVYLEALRITGDPEWQERADWIARFLIDMRFDHGDESWWLVGNLRFPTADLMVGNSGILHFLLRYAFPGQLSFPMLPDILKGTDDQQKQTCHV